MLNNLFRSIHRLEQTERLEHSVDGFWQIKTR